ncbi:rhomboid family intramembrane serine protease [Fundidesulfovibrio terrae]|uniref:rhomboid family intramembrane serine protease n=1 Tax=Fundidesulfovibrio terrae TaxID=2922866 RepID=UPI001FAEBAA6|nr:rhomboid family intramembrane serine protease [Fundidesulfovibrio terrae]
MLPTQRQSWPDIAPELLEAVGLPELTMDMAQQWALVLQARRVPNRIRQGWPGLRLLVPASRREEALEELRAYLEENPPEPVSLPDLRPRPSSWGELPGVLWSLSIVTVFLTLTGAENTLGAWLVDWHQLGGGDTRLMASGEWWRAVTALTLHADVAHLVGNVCLGGTFLLLLAGEVGLGSAWFLSLAGAVWANAAKMPMQAPGYRFIGSSTAVFASLGALAGVRLVRLGRHLRWRRALPFAAGLMILAFLGVGSEEESRRIDLAGHFMGFGAGVVLGAGYACVEKLAKRSGRGLSPWLGVAAAAVVALSWALALLV